MIHRIDELKENIKKDLTALKDHRALEDFRVRFLGRKGHITELFKQIKDVEPEIRKEFGLKLNELKNWADKELTDLRSNIGGGETISDVEDLSLPSYRIPVGKLHPLTQTLNDII